MLIQVRNDIQLSQIPPALKTIITSRLIMNNPKFEEAERMGRWTEDIPECLQFYEPLTDGGMAIPRGYARQLCILAKKHKVSYALEDRRRSLPEIDFNFIGKLKPFQQRAVGDICRRDFGTLEAPTGAGKTVMALAIIADRKQPAMVIVHSKELLNQWIARIETFLGIPGSEIGIIGAGKSKIGTGITVGMVQTLCKMADEVVPYIGHVIVDECHRTPSRTFTEAVSAFDARYMLGLSATPWRRDKLSRLIFLALGDVVHKVNKAGLIDRGDILPATIITRDTDFRPFSDPTTEYSRMLSELTEDDARNHLITGDITRVVEEGGGTSLVLSDRKGHCEALQRLLKAKGIETELLTGDIRHKDRQAIVARLDQGQIQVLIATGQLVGEGFDCKNLTTLFLATPIKFSGRVLQYLGRVLRPAPGKSRATVYDYVDRHVGPLRASAMARQKVYASAA